MPLATRRFLGFDPQGLDFLRLLAQHNERDWFEAHRDVYREHLQEPLRDLVHDLAATLSERQIPLTGDPKRSLFRIHRDVRFSADKSPYKTHVSAVLSQTGNKHEAGILYLHIDPNESFAASGFYGLPTPELNRIRHVIVEDPKAFLATLPEPMGDETQDASTLKTLHFSEVESLKRLPKGFTTTGDDRIDHALRQKHLILKRTLDEDLLGRAELAEALVDVADRSLPMLRFGWNALAS